MESKKREVELNIKDLGKVLLRCWWIMLLVGVIVAVGLYLALYLTHTDEYTATVSVYVMREALVKPEGSDAAQTQGVDVSISNNIKADVLVLPFMHRVLDPVLQDAGMDVTEKNYAKLQKAISTQSKEDEHIVYISATSKDPENAKTVANLVAAETCRIFNEVLFENERYVTVLDEARTPEKPSNPISKVTVALAGLAAMLVVYLVFLILFLTDDKINDAEDVQNYLGVSTLGQIPNRRDTGKRRKGYGKYYQTYGADGKVAEAENGGKKGGAAK